MQEDLFSKVTEFPVVAFEEHGVGELNNRIHNDTDRIISLFSNFINLASRFIAAFIIVIVFIKINIVIALEVIIFAILSFFITKYFSPKMKESNKKVKEKNDELMKDSTQLLTGIREVKALGIKKRVKAHSKMSFTLFIERK